MTTGEEHKQGMERREQQEAFDQQQQGLKGSTLFITNMIKLAGLVFAVNELLIRGEMRPIAVGVAALCMAGAQVSEDVLLGIIDSFFGRKDRRGS
jgi:hypothetical protein